MRVSIVIPVYNAEPYLDECIRSALDQTYPNTEIIAVDDGSTDSSPEILDGYADRIRVFRKPNGGTASALNHGYRQMRGDWFKWLSADDLLKPYAVQTLVSAALAIDNPTKRIFYADYDTIDEDGSIVLARRNRERNYNNLDNFERNVILLDHFYGNGITSMFHRSIFASCGMFDETIGFNEDYEFLLRCCILHGYMMHYVFGVVAKWRVHASQLTTIHGDDEQRSKNDHIRSLVMSRLSQQKVDSYMNALSDYRKPPPRHVRLRRNVRDMVFSYLPGNTSDRIVHAHGTIKKLLRSRPTDNFPT